MIVLIFGLALAIGSVASAAVAAIAKEAARSGYAAICARPSRFPAISLLDPAAGKMFSLLVRSINLAQPTDFAGNFRSGRGDFGVETKIFPALSPVAGKFAAAGSEHAQPKDPVDRIEAGQDAL